MQTSFEHSQREEADLRNEKLNVSPDKRPVSPSADRNKGPIAAMSFILPARCRTRNRYPNRSCRR